LIPDSCQLVCTNTSEQLSALRFAGHSRADYIFVKDIVEPESLNNLAFTASQDRTIIFAQTTSHPWQVHRSLLAADKYNLFAKQIRTIYLFSSLELIKSATHSENITTFPSLQNDSGAATENNYTVGYLWQHQADRQHKSDTNLDDYLSQKLFHGLQQKWDMESLKKQVY
ncbi:MAG: hypothetical protein ACE5I1_27080, partial [bacterium]